MRVATSPGKPSGAAHRRNRSEPISPHHRAALAALPRQGRLSPLRFELPPALTKHTVLADWTSWSTRLLGCVLALLLLLAVATVPRAADPSPHASHRLKEPVLLHQTVPSLNLSSDEVAWRRSWEELGFQLRIADDESCREHIKELVRLTGKATFLQVYDALETGVQRADMWRYAVLYLYGGVYADVDVLAKPHMADLVNENLNRSGVVFVESLPSPWLIGFIARFLYVTDMVRVPQYRNCIMIARRRLPAMRLTLENIVSKFLDPPVQRQPEPTYTLELTGPGIFTDSVKAAMGSPLDPPGSRRKGRQARAAGGVEGAGLKHDVPEPMEPAGEKPDASDALADTAAAGSPISARQEAEEAAAGDEALLHISRLAGHRYFEHVGRGSWKMWRGPDVRGWRSMFTEKARAAKEGKKRSLDPHEVRLLALISLVLLGTVSASLSTAYGRQLCSTYCKLRNSTAERWRLASTSLRAKLQAVLPQQRRAMLSRRLIQCFACLVAVSGLRSQCGARCLNPWRVVGFWLFLFERRLLPRTPPSTAQLGKIATESHLAVVGCGRTLGTSLISSGTLDAVEQIGSYFKTYEVHLLLQLVVRERDNTRNALRAWAVRNPQVKIHQLLVESVKSLPASARSQMGDEQQLALSRLYRAGVATVHALPPRIGHVLMLDTEAPHPFSSAALVEALTWSSRWDGVCATAMEADGIITHVDLANHAVGRPGAGGEAEAVLEEQRRVHDAAVGAGASRVQARSGAVPVQSCASALALYRREAWQSCTRWEAALEATTRRGDAAGNELRELARGGGADISGGDVGGFGGDACKRAELHRCMAAQGHGRLFILPSLAIRLSDPQQDLLYVLLTLAILLPALAPCVAFCKRRLVCSLPSAGPALPGVHLCGTLAIGKRQIRVRKRVLVVLTIVVLFQVGLLCRRLHRSAAAAFAATTSAYQDGAHDSTALEAGDEGASTLISIASLVLPLVLPCLTAIDLILSRSSSDGSLAFRIPTAALTVLVPLFVLLELRRLQSIELPESPGTRMPDGDEGGVGLLLEARDLASWLRQPWPNSLGLCPPVDSGCGAHPAT